MIEININPVVFILGPWEVKWVDITAIVSFAAVIMVSIYEMKRLGLPDYKKRTGGLTLCLLLGSLIGGKLFYFLDNWDYVLSHPLMVLSDFILIYGVLLGGMAGVSLYIRLKKLPPWRYGDAFAPGAMLGLALNRVGCIIDGCCFGIRTDLPWAVVYTNPDTWAPFGKLLYFTQAYMFVLGLVVFFVVWYLRDKLRPDGALFLLWVALFAATDLVVRFFRAANPFLPGLQQAQLIGILLLLVTVPLLIIRVRAARPSS
jgi:phosphatidylglycerol:prolipoprotein diacylglycerol transferase